MNFSRLKWDFGERRGELEFWSKLSFDIKNNNIIDDRIRFNFCLISGVRNFILFKKTKKKLIFIVYFLFAFILFYFILVFLKINNKFISNLKKFSFFIYNFFM